MKEKSSHWYSRTGEACHTQPTKSRAAKNPTRPTNIRDAMTLGLLPSVTTILSLLDKPQLQDWKNQQVAAAGLALARAIVCFDPNVPISDAQAADIALLRDPTPLGDDILTSRIIESAFQQVEDAKDAGEAIHAAAALALAGLEYDEDAGVYLPEPNLTLPMKTFIKPVQQFIAEHEITVTHTELRVVNLKHGYAGTADAPMRCKRGRGIGDHKTRKTKPGKPVFAYDEQPTQIASYHAGHYGEDFDAASGWNLFISTTEPGRVEAVWYDETTLSREWEAFTHLAAYWRLRKGYDPRVLS